MALTPTHYFGTKLCRANRLNPSHAIRSLFLAAAASFLLAGSLFAKEEEKVILNFVSVDIESVAKAIGQITGKNFLVDPRVKGTVNIVSATPIPRSLTYDVFLSALRLQGFSAVESAGVVKLIPEADAKFQNGVTTGLDRVRGDKIVTHVFSLKHESANLLMPVIRPMVSPNNPIAAYPQSNVLVITDYAENLKRIQAVIESIDQPGNLAPEFITLKNATAAEVAQTIRALLGDAGSEPSQKLIIHVEPRSNSILVRADDASRLARIRELAAKIDAATDIPGSVHVISLKNAEAVKVAETLKNIVSVFQTTGAGASSSITGPSTPAVAPGATSTATAANATVAAPSFSTSAAGLTNSTSSGVSIQADAAINALIVTAPEAIYRNLRAVIEKLDTRRSQVHVEALVVELNSDKAAEFGIQWQNLSGFEAGNANAIKTVGGTNFGGTGQNIVSTATNLASVGRGLSIGKMKGTVIIPGTTTAITSLGLLARMLESTGSANILSTPNIMTLDNEEAKLSVGQNIPIVTGTYQQTAGGPSPFQTIERKDIGLLLKIKPQISEGAIRMRIYQEVSSVVSTSDTQLAAAQGVTTNKRSVDTNVLVDDGEIIVIGGLIQDNFQDQRDQVPLLGDIPVLGGLFRYDTKRHVKTNLMVFIRPLVVRDVSGYRNITAAGYDDIRSKQENEVPKNTWMLPDERGAVLPPLKGSATPVTPAAR